MLRSIATAVVLSIAAAATAVLSSVAIILVLTVSVGDRWAIEPVRSFHVVWAAGFWLLPLAVAVGAWLKVLSLIERRWGDAGAASILLSLALCGAFFAAFWYPVSNVNACLFDVGLPYLPNVETPGACNR